MNYIKLFENFNNKEFKANYYKATYSGLDEDIFEAFECTLKELGIKYSKNDEFIQFKVEESEYWILLNSYEPARFGKPKISLIIRYSGDDKSINQFKDMFDELLIEKEKEYDFDHDDYYDNNVEFFLYK